MTLAVLCVASPHTTGDMPSWSGIFLPLLLNMSIAEHGGCPLVHTATTPYLKYVLRTRERPSSRRLGQGQQALLEARIFRSS